MKLKLGLIILCGIIPFQNCAKKTFTNEPEILNSLSTPTPTPIPTPPPNTCEFNQALCIGNHKIRSVNGALASLGEFSISNAIADSNGYIDVKIQNPISGRIGFLKIRYYNGVLQAIVDSSKTTYPWVCLNHSETPTAMIGGTPNCWSPIRVFDEKTVVDVGITGGVPVAPAYHPNDKARTEIPGGIDVLAVQLSKGCRCQFKPSHVTTLQGQAVFTSITSNSWLRVDADANRCVDIPMTANGAFFETCAVSSPL